MLGRFLLFFFLASQCFAANQLLDILYLTFEEENTSSSITVNFQATEQSENPGQVYYDTQARDGNIESYSFKASGRTHYLSSHKRTLHHVKLSQLTSNTTYYFVVGNSQIGHSQEMKFKTLPNDGSAIHMVTGGDMDVGQEVVETSRWAISQDPHIILIGGDIAYANGKNNAKGLRRWDKWFGLMKQVALSPSGHIIPLVAAIGNHEVSFFPQRSPWFGALFPQGQGLGKTYFVKKLGNHSALIVLDSGHQHSHQSQASWLEHQLQRFQNLPNRLALYHAPLFPNHRSFNDNLARKGRKYWQPLFDRYNLTAAFENHDHTLKRTFPIQGPRIGLGTVYIGDGCWGVSPRPSRSAKWYLARAISDNHVWTIRADRDYLNMMASGVDGQILDHVNVINFSGKTIVQELPLR